MLGFAGHQRAQLGDQCPACALAWGDMQEISARCRRDIMPGVRPRLAARHGPCISRASPLYLPCISPVSPVHLPYISGISRLAARHGPPRWRPAWSLQADSEHLVRVRVRVRDTVTVRVRARVRVRVRVRLRARVSRALRAPPGLLGLGLASASGLGAASSAAAMGSSTRTPTAAKVTPSSWPRLGVAIQLEG